MTCAKHCAQFKSIDNSWSKVVMDHGNEWLLLHWRTQIDVYLRVYSVQYTRNEQISNLFAYRRIIFNIAFAETFALASYDAVHRSEKKQYLINYMITFRKRKKNAFLALSSALRYRLYYIKQLVSSITVCKCINCDVSFHKRSNIFVYRFIPQPREHNRYICIQNQKYFASLKFYFVKSFRIRKHKSFVCTTVSIST